MKHRDLFFKASSKVPGWTRGEEAHALFETAYDLPDRATVVEIGSFLGCGSILLGGARKMKGSGEAHCVDRFDGSGDAFSTPHYHAIWLALGARPFREIFDENIADAGLSDWISVHDGDAELIGRRWSKPIDMLFLDGDQSPEGVRAVYDAWSPWLKNGAVIALHNSAPREYEQHHDGHYILARKEIRAPSYEDIRLVGSTTFARKAVQKAAQKVAAPKRPRADRRRRSGHRKS